MRCDIYTTIISQFFVVSAFFLVGHLLSPRRMTSLTPLVPEQPPYREKLSFVTLPVASVK